MAFKTSTEDRFTKLQAFFASLMLVPHNSRYVEAEHAKIQIGLRRANRHSDSYVSLLRRQPVLMKELRACPHMLEDLAFHVTSVRHGRDAVEALGLGAHPACSRATASSDSIYWQVIYHADDWTKYHMEAPALFYHSTAKPHQLEARAAAGPAGENHKFCVHKTFPYQY